MAQQPHAIDIATFTEHNKTPRMARANSHLRVVSPRDQEHHRENGIETDEKRSELTDISVRIGSLPMVSPQLRAIVRAPLPKTVDPRTFLRSTLHLINSHAVGRHPYADLIDGAIEVGLTMEETMDDVDAIKGFAESLPRFLGHRGGIPATVDFRLVRADLTAFDQPQESDLLEPHRSEALGQFVSSLVVSIRKPKTPNHIE